MTTDSNMTKEEAMKKRQNERFAAKEAQVSAKYLKRVEELKGFIPELNPFTDVLRNIYVNMKGIDCDPTIKRIGTYCVMAPQELIYAADAVPVKLCSGNYTAFAVGDDYVPRDACPLVKAAAGFCENGRMPLYEECSLMVVPITCDCKKKIAGMLSEKREVFTLHVPVTKEDKDIENYKKELYSLAGYLETITGNKITYQSLSEGMRKVGHAQYELSEFIRIRRKNPYIIKGTHAMAVMNAYSYMTADKWADALHSLNAALEKKAGQKNIDEKKKLPRILHTGSPVIFPNMKVPLMIEEMGGFFAADETCMGERGLYDPAVIVDDSFDGMMRALTNRAIRPCSCPTFADNKQRVYRIKQMIKDNKIEGIIYHVLRGCLVYDFEYKMLEEEMGKIGVPIIRLESDYNEEDVEQLRIRIEAFIELIKLSKEPVKRTGIRKNF